MDGAEDFATSGSVEPCSPKLPVLKSGEEMTPEPEEIAGSAEYGGTDGQRMMVI